MITKLVISHLPPLPSALALAMVFVPVGAVGGTQQAPSSQGIEFFENKIRPVLSKHCYECHSTQSTKIRGGLLLDSKEGILKGGESGPALVPGRAKDSLIIKALRHEDDLQMPPRSKKLDDAIIADFIRWIDTGALDPRAGKAIAATTFDLNKGRAFWSFQPLAKMMPPAVKNQAWVRTPIDRFILAKLEANGLAPNRPLSRERLVRRVHFDLLGLPPTPEDVEAFVNDASPDAYEKLVDRLLANEQMGERWARHWLDLVRFAETSGYVFDGYRPNAYHYRDFVIKAFNQDIPFDQFVRWQIAGDHLEPKNPLAVAATGFLVAGPQSDTTEKTRELVRYNQLDDMISTLGSSMLGLSIGCARCHAHKYDPIPQEDYYRLLACLGHTERDNAQVDPHPEGYRKVKADYDKVHSQLITARAKFEKVDLPVRLRNAVEAGKDMNFAWIALDKIAWPTDKFKTVSKIIANKTTPEPAQGSLYEFRARTYLKDITGIRVEAPPGKKFLPMEFRVNAAPLDETAEAVSVKLRALTRRAEPVSSALYEIDAANGFDGGTVLTFSLRYAGAEPANFAVSITTSARPVIVDEKAESQKTGELHLLLSRDQGKLTAKNRAGVLHWMRAGDTEMEKIYKAVETHDKSAPMPVFGPIYAATTAKKGEAVHYLVRGEVEKKGAVMTPGFVQVLMNTTDAEKTWTANVNPQAPRAAMANWITDVDNGAGKLLARVIVNRLWQHHMSRGIVATPNDFGAQGEPPTHPELLDYLARELINNGWRLRPIHKLIMSSAVYMQAGELSAANMKSDPQNRLWWRRPIRRLEAEAIRDSILAVSGLLDRRMYGPGTLDGRDPSRNSFLGKAEKDTTPTDTFDPRRSIYLTVKHSWKIPLLHMFDFPEAMQSIGERSVTTVPTQSLAFLNSSLVRRAAAQAAKRIQPNPTKITKETFDLAYMTVLSRRPTPKERERLAVFFQRQGERYGNSPQAHEMALTDCCQVLLCSNEFIFVE